MVDVLVRAGAIVDQQAVNGETPLYMAASRGEARAVAVLLGAKANPLLDCAGYTPGSCGEVRFSGSGARAPTRLAGQGYSWQLFSGEYCCMFFFMCTCTTFVLHLIYCLSTLPPRPPYSNRQSHRLDGCFQGYGAEAGEGDASEALK